MSCYQPLEYQDYHNIIEKLNKLDPHSTKAKLISSAKLEICKSNTDPEYEIVNGDEDDNNDNMDIDFSASDNTSQLNNTYLSCPLSCPLLDIIYGNVLIVEFTFVYKNLTGYDYDANAFFITRSKLESYLGTFNNEVKSFEYDLPNDIIPEYIIEEYVVKKQAFYNSLFVQNEKNKGKLFTANINECLTNDIMLWLSKILDD